jgi:hypothetical protein
MANANAAIYVSWGGAIPGREAKSLEVFMHAVEYYGRLEKEGKIAALRTYVATTGNSKFSGFMVIEGEVAQLRTLVDSDEYKSILVKARHLVEGVDVVHCVTGGEVLKSIEQLVAARKQLGI